MLLREATMLIIKKTKTTHKYIQNKIVHFEVFGNILWTNSDLYLVLGQCWFKMINMYPQLHYRLIPKFRTHTLRERITNSYVNIF